MTLDIVSRIWGFCHTLRHDGIDYGDYIEQITYLLFLKMADERGIELPERADWPYLRKQSGTDLLSDYQDALRRLGSDHGLLGDIYSGAQSRFSNPVSLKRLIELIDETEWTAVDIDVKGAIFEGLLEKAAAEGKKGAGQYFTPRILIRAIVQCVKPDPRMIQEFKVGDPAVGTGGFLVVAYEWLVQQTGGVLDRDTARRIRMSTFYGQDLVARPRRLALMNLYLHQVDPHITLGDSIYETPSTTRYDVVLTNPPFGTRGANQAPDRDDFTVRTSNKQLNFLQHVLTILKPGGRAAIVVPDNVLFADQAGEVFEILMEDCDVHTVLRCPRGTFSPYSPGTKTNVVFFTKGRSTSRVWIYDARANVPAITKKDRPLTPEYFAEFVQCFGSNPEGRSERAEGASSSGRWRAFSIDEVRDHHYKLDSFKWLRDENVDGEAELGEPEEIITTAVENLKLAIDALGDVQALLEYDSDGEGAEVPDGWGRSSVEALCWPKSIAYGVLKPGPQQPGGVPMLRVKDLHGGAIDASDLYHITSELDAQYMRTKLQGGELLLSIQGSVGRVAIVPKSLSGANLSRTLAVLRPIIPEFATWLWMWFQSASGQDDLREAVGGTTRDSLNLRDLRRLVVPVAPLEEQRRIHARVMALFEAVDTAVPHIDSARATVADRVVAGPTRSDRLKAAVLTKAFRGVLVPTQADLAVADGGTFETADELLARTAVVAQDSSQGGARRLRLGISPAT